MPRILALDWDRTEVRCLLATSSGRSMKIHLAACAPLATVAEAGGTSHPDVGGSLRSMLADQGLGRPNTVVAVDRFAAETIVLTLPPAKDSELAALVHNQVLRDSQTYTEGSVIDFVALSDDPAAPRAVSAAVCTAAQLERIRLACGELGLRPTRVVLRPLATATYFREAMPGHRTSLLVNVIGEEADLVLMVEGSPVYFRTVRLPPSADAPLVARHLTSEVQRTLVAALRGAAAVGTVDQIYVLGSAQEHALLVGLLERTVGVPAANFDPFDAGGAVEVAGDLPEGAGKFAPLLGMIADEARGAHPIDFLHPRRVPKPPDRRRWAALAALLLAALAIGGGYSYWDSLNDAQQENDELEKTRKKLAAEVRDSSYYVDLWDELEAWRSGEIVWLDEIRDLAQRLPPARDLLVQRMSVSTGRNGEGAVDLACMARSPAVVSGMARTLRDDEHLVGGIEMAPRAPEGGYAWSVNPRITVLQPRTAEQYQTSLPAAAEPAAAGESAATTPPEAEGPAKPDEAKPDVAKPDDAAKPDEAKAGAASESPPGGAASNGATASPDDAKGQAAPDSAAPQASREEGGR